MSLEFIPISKREYENLLKDSVKLQMLEAGGVDNWPHYSDCFYGDFVDKDLDEEYEEIELKVYGKVKE